MVVQVEGVVGKEGGGGEVRSVKCHVYTCMGGEKRREGRSQR